jgi:hypothetical protein
MLLGLFACQTTEKSATGKPTYEDHPELVSPSVILYVARDRSVYYLYLKALGKP